MYKKLAAMLLFIMSSSIAVAQTIVTESTSNSVLKSTVVAQPLIVNSVACISGEELIELTNQYRELPFVRGVSSEGRSVVIFANPATGSFTILERRGQNTFCALVVGAGFEPVPKDIQDEMKESQNQGRM